MIVSHPLRLAAALFAASLATIPIGTAAGTRVYIPTGEAAQVVVIDALADLPTGRIEGLPAAHGLAITPNGARLVVGSFEERAPGEAQPAKPEAVSAADHAAHHSTGAAAPSGEAISTVSVIDVATGAVLRRIDVPGAVHHVAISPDGAVAVVTHPNRGAVTVIDLTAYAVIGTVPTGTLPNYAAFSPDGSRLYVSNAGDDTVAALNTATWTVAGRIATGAEPEHLVLTPDGGRLLVNNVAGGSVSVIDTATGQVAETLPVGATPHGIDLSDDGRTAFVALRGEDRVVAIDLRTRAFRSGRLGPAPYHLAAVRGRGVLYVSSDEASRVWVVDAATLAPLGKIEIPGIGHQFAQASGF